MVAAISPFGAILAAVVAVLLSMSAAAAASNDTLTAYEVLEEYDFPIGLLPQGVVSYALDSSTGKFAVYLNETCTFSLEGSYDIKYKSTITGYISSKKLSSLSGISVKVLFFWLNIVEVTVDGDDLEFSVGIASASFSVTNFAVCPQCGCGLDCVSLATSA
ncbi:unnamed protein product [Victoria cruziana]